jgi:hypothetical protein
MLFASVKFLIILLFLVLVHAKNTTVAATTAVDNKIPFLLDFLKAQNIPTHPIIWENCFTPREKFELVKSSFNPTTFYRQDSLKRSDFGVNPQYCLFILDLTCTQSPERIIQKVNTIENDTKCTHFYYYSSSTSC